MSSDVYDMFAAAQPNNQPREEPTDRTPRGIMSEILRRQIQGLPAGSSHVYDLLQDD